MEDMLFPPLGPWQSNGTSRLGQKGSSSASVKGNAAEDAGRNGELKKACVDMEAQFIYYLFKEMRNTVPEDGLIPKGSAEKMYTAMLDTEMAEELAKKGGIGLADTIYRQLTERADNAETTGEKE